MKKWVVSAFLLFALMSSWSLALGDGLTCSDPANLTFNCDMNTFSDHSSEGQIRIVADGWWFWVESGNPAFDVGQDSTVPPSQRIWSDGGTFRAGIYQEVDNLTAGATYIGEVEWVPYTSPDGSIMRQVGLDPMGGTDPNGPSVVWGPEDWKFSRFTDLEVRAVAAGSKMTIFIRVFNPVSHGADQIFIDAARLRQDTSVPIQAAATPTGSASATVTPTMSASATATPTMSASATVTPTMSASATVTPTMSASGTVTPTMSASGTVTPTMSASATVTPTMRASATVTPTMSASPTITPTMSASPTASATATPTMTPSPTATRPPAPTPLPPNPQDCLFFTETGGGKGGYSVCDDAQADFRSAFEAWGLQKVGYPISRRYFHDGFVAQAFQKVIMQWRAESGTVVLVNIFDDLHNAGYDDILLEMRQTPKQLPDGWDEDRPFDEVISTRQALLNERPALQAAYFASNDPLTFYGLPTSEVQDMDNHYAIRLQRGVLQEWKEDVPWAKAGEVTIANGGDIAKELGGLPVEALSPETGLIPSGPP
ncbi:MAG: hypothetical protein ACPGWR_12870 [Ardenticatenaceae bacterium]